MKRIVAIIAAAGLVAWVAVDQLTGSSKSTSSQDAPPIGITEANLTNLATASAAPIYWIGHKPGETLELTKTTDGKVYLRYLPAGVAVGSSTPYLTVSTYPVANAFRVTAKAASASSTVKVAVGSGGVAFYSKHDPASVYVAYPGSNNVQVEVYDPAAGEAARFVSAGKVVEVVPKPTVITLRAVTESGLAAIASTSPAPIYWAGPTAGVTYEISRTIVGNTYVRYLPAGVKAGTAHRYQTIATYPVARAFAVTRALARKAGSVRVPVSRGGIAFYYAKRPTSVYLAYPQGTVQIEVYDPSAALARRLVGANAITPVG